MEFLANTIKRLSVGILFLVTSASLGESIALSTDAITTLENDNTYLAKVEGATYRVTTHGESVRAKLTVSATVTLILDNCRLYYSGTPLTIAGTQATVNLRFTGENHLVATSTSSAQQAIHASSSSAPTLIIGELPGEATTHSLFLRGTSTDSTYADSKIQPVINLTKSGSIIFKSGNIRIATSEHTAILSGSYQIPALASANAITICGGTITAQMCPRNTTNEISGSQLLNNKIVSPLFACTTFTQSGGLITTAGDNKCPYDSNQYLKASTNAYDTTYAYHNIHMENHLTTATTPSFVGGGLRSPTKAWFYGFRQIQELPAACFSHTGTGTLQNQSPDENGTVLVENVNVFYTDLTLNYTEPQMQAVAEVFEAPLTPTDNGIVVKGTFGIHDIRPGNTERGPILTLALNLPGDTQTTEKTLNIQILCAFGTTKPEVVLDQSVTFTRNSTRDRFTASVTLDPLTSNAIGTYRYTVRAYN